MFDPLFGGGATAQPQGAARVNWANPLTRGLRYASSERNSQRTNVVNGVVLTPRPVSFVNGLGFLYCSGSDSIADSRVYDIGAPTELTVFSIWLPPPGAEYYGADGNTDLLTTYNGGSGGWYFGRSSATNGSGNGNVTRAKFTIRAVADYTLGSYTIPSFLPTKVGMRWKASAVEFFDDGGNGAFVSRGTVGTASSINASSASLYEPGYWKGRSAVTLVWNRYLSNSEFKAIAANPWQLFLPPADSSPIYIPSSNVERPILMDDVPAVMTRQPQSDPKIDWTNPITRGLIIAWVPTSADTVFNAVTGAVIGNWTTNSGEPSTPVVMGTGAAGRAIVSTHDYITPTSACPNVADATTGVSFLVYAQHSAYADGSSRYYFTRGQDGSGTGWSLGISAVGTTKLWSVAAVTTSPSTAGYTATQPDTFTIDRPYVVAGRYRESADVTLFIDGKKSATTTGVGKTLRSSTRGFYWGVGITSGSDTGLTAGAFGKYYLSLVWNRALSDQEHISIGANPWQVFQRQTITILEHRTPTDLDMWPTTDIVSNLRTTQPRG